jgi:COP9 signalosome complex subunit 5
LGKIEDFGVHCKNYYPLNISYFKSSLDSSILNFMWTTYWKNTLASNPLQANSQYLSSQVSDLAAKLEKVSAYNL